jgi:hypothetical protein
MKTDLFEENGGAESPPFPVVKEQQSVRYNQG